MITSNLNHVGQYHLNPATIHSKILKLNDSINKKLFKSIVFLTSSSDTKSLLNYQDKASEYPLYIAVKSGSKRIVELLLKRGANPNIISRVDGLAPLQIAAANGLKEITSLLINAGAHSNILNEEACTPAMIAFAYNQIETALFLQSQSKNFDGYWQELLMLNHRFGLTEKVQIDSVEQSLEGLFFNITTRFLQKSFEKFMKEELLKQSQNIDESKEVFESILDSIKFSVICTDNYNAPLFVREIVNNIHNNKVVPLCTGWDEHGTVAVISKDKLIKCNRGSGTSLKTSGSLIFRINHLENISDVVKKLLLDHESASNKHFFRKQINDLLLLTFSRPVFQLRHSEQENGTCTWASLKTALRAIVWLKQSEVIGDPKVAVITSLQLYKKWSLWDRNYSIKQFIETSDGNYSIGKHQVLHAIYKKSLLPKGPASKLDPDVKALLSAYA